MQLISVDDHLIEHPKVWSDRLPRKYLEAGRRSSNGSGPTPAKCAKCGNTRAASIPTSG
ncbi:putative amidohydrolase 2 [Mycobacterium xenopi 4042]|uniref:Putative amidohydrolase 2 n=1 Tax=Mycobacterium xenopi 4042 TaxID=1299334 RepID=X7ZWU7_MYCXE|nr:putative amidohydrolase 2 [Mycobacterium xenopi 4042]